MDIYNSERDHTIEKKNRLNGKLTHLGQAKT